MRARATAATLAVCLAAVVVCAGEPPRLEAKVPAAAVSVGDRVSVQVTAVGGLDAMWGELSVDPSQQWAVVVGPRAVAAAEPPAWTVVLAPLATGKLELPAMSASVRSADGTSQAATLAERPELTVASVLPPGEDPKPAALRAPIGVHGLPWEWILPGLLAALPVIGVVAWALHRRRPVVPARAQLLAPMAELEAELAGVAEALGSEPATVTCDRMATALRRYLERRSGEPALEMTSFELRLTARRLSWPEPVQRTIQRVMAIVDGIRFGRRQASGEDLRRALTDALELGRALEAHLVVPEEAAS